MTSLNKLKEQIFEFLAKEPTEEPTQIGEVLAIRGAWGVGKTYAWNVFLKEAKNKNKIALKKYSYVSLFGINSLDELKFSIYLNAKDISFICEDKKQTLNFCERFCEQFRSFIKKLPKRLYLVITHPLKTCRRFIKSINCINITKLFSHD